MSTKNENRVTKDISARTGPKVSEIKTFVEQRAMAAYYSTKETGYEEQIHLMEAEHSRQLQTMETEHNAHVQKNEAEHKARISTMETERSNQLQELKIQYETTVAEKHRELHELRCSIPQLQQTAKAEGMAQERKEIESKTSSLQTKILELNRDNQRLGAVIAHRDTTILTLKTKEKELQTTVANSWIQVNFQNTKSGCKTRTYYHKPTVTLDHATQDLRHELRNNPPTCFKSEDRCLLDKRETLHEVSRNMLETAVDSIAD